jgi:hypothetical protein
MPNWLTGTVRWASYASLAVVMLVALVLLIKPAFIRSTVQGSSGPPSPAAAVSGEDDMKLANQAQSEYWALRGDHYFVAVWFAHCSGVEDVFDLPNALTKYLTPFGDSDWNGTDKKIEKEPTIQQREVAQLSLGLTRARLGVAGVARTTQAQSEFMQWIIILLGLFTTIVISLSSTEYGKGDGKWPKGLRFVAITLPALGTAVAAFNAFYAPSAKAAQAERTLASLGQLHSQIAHEIWTIGCADDPNRTSALDSKISSWIKRYQEIQTLAATGPADKGSEPPGGGSAGPSGAKGKSQ